MFHIAVFKVVFSGTKIVNLIQNKPHKCSDKRAYLISKNTICFSNGYHLLFNQPTCPAYREQNNGFALKISEATRFWRMMRMNREFQDVGGGVEAS